MYMLTVNVVSLKKSNNNLELAPLWHLLWANDMPQTSFHMEIICMWKKKKMYVLF